MDADLLQRLDAQRDQAAGSGDEPALAIDVLADARDVRHGEGEIHLQVPLELLALRRIEMLVGQPLGVLGSERRKRRLHDAAQNAQARRHARLQEYVGSVLTGGVGYQAVQRQLAGTGYQHGIFMNTPGSSIGHSHNSLATVTRIYSV